MSKARWLKFERQFNFIPKKKSSITQQYPAGWVGSVTDECAEKAIKVGAAVEVEAPADAATAAAIKAGEQDPTVVTPPAEDKVDDKPAADKKARA